MCANRASKIVEPSQNQITEVQGALPYRPFGLSPYHLQMRLGWPSILHFAHSSITHFYIAFCTIGFFLFFLFFPPSLSLYII